MDFRYLKCFYLVGIYKSFSKAAGELHIAQSAVSRQIQMLEDSLKSQLFIRAGKHVTLTPRGQLLLDEVSKFESWSNNFMTETRPAIRIASLEGVGSRWLTDRLLGVTEDGISLHIRHASPDKIIQDLSEGKIDFGLVSRKVEHPLISWKRLFREKLCLVSARPVQLKDLSDLPWICVDKGTYLLRVAKKPSAQLIRAGSLDNALTFVRSGFGVGIFPEHLLAHHKGLHTMSLQGLDEEWIYLGSLNYESPSNDFKTVHRALTSLSGTV